MDTATAIQTCNDRMKMKYTSSLRALQSPRIRMALLTWVGIWPLITVLLVISKPWLGDLPLPLRTFIMTGVLVPSMMFVVVPQINRIANTLGYVARDEPIVH